MKIPVRTLANGFTMPALGKGTWMAGTKKKTYQDTDEGIRAQAIANALENGFTYFDTAERYAAGYGEELVGKAIKGVDRKSLLITTKLSSRNYTYADVLLAAKQSINRLKSSYLDIYFIHKYDKRVSLREVMKAMDYLIEHDLVKHIGVCNFTIDQLIEVQSYTKHKIVANQIKYNFLINTKTIDEVITYCEKNDMLVIVWKMLTTVPTDQQQPILEHLAKKYNTSQAQVSNAWLAQRENVVMLTEFSSQKEIANSLELFNISFTRDDIQSLNNDYKTTQERRIPHDK